MLLLISCGSDSATQPCRPQEIAIAECQVTEWEKNPSTFNLDFQERYCNNLYPFEICYAY